MIKENTNLDLWHLHTCVYNYTHILASPQFSRSIEMFIQTTAMKHTIDNILPQKSPHRRVGTIDR